MRSRSLSAVGLLLGVACVATQNTRAANVQFDGETGTDFTVGANWADNNPPTADGDVHFVENGLTSDLTGTATVNGVVIGDSSVGTLNVNGGTLNVNVTGGFPQGFSLGGHLSNHTGLGTVNITNGGTVNMTRLGGSPDTAFVGERADGVLNIGPNSALNAPDFVWRIGQFGGDYGEMFTATGVINVEGTFGTRYMYLAPNGGDSELTVSGNGSLVVTQGLHSSIDTFRGERSSIIRTVGSNATLTADDIFANTEEGQVRNQFIFVADSGGVSEIQALDAILFDNASVTVDLSAFGELTEDQSLLLFDAAPGQLANGHEFGALNVIGVSDPSRYSLRYDDDATGDIFLVVPEPSAAALIGMAVAGMGMFRRRRA